LAVLTRGAIASATATVPETTDPSLGCSMVAPPPLAKATEAAQMDIRQTSTNDEIFDR
jgi:hypothetical protein